jgi:O-antigen/teichoic acid export membrane protein
MQPKLQISFISFARAQQNWFTKCDNRTKQILLGSGAMMFSTLVNTMTRVGMVALLARIYAREEFGVWVAITSMTAVIATSDFGIGNALRNKLAALVTKGKIGNDEAREYFLSVFYFLLIAAFLFSIGLLIAGHFIPFQLLFKTSDVSLQHAGAYILIAVQIIFLFSIPLGLASVMFFAYQETLWSAAFSMAYGLFSMVIVCILALIKQSIVSTAIYYFLAGLVINVVGTAAFLVRRRWNPFQVTLRLILPRVWSLLSISMRFAAIQVAGAFIYNSATLVTSAIIGVADASEYNLVQKLYTLAIALYLSVYNPLWMGYAAAIHRDDWNWCKRTLEHTLILTTIVFGGIAIIFTFFGNFFLQILAGKGYVSQSMLFALLGLWALFYILWSCVMAFLTAAENVNIMVIFTVFIAIIFTPISGIIGQNLGIIGIAASSALAFTPLAIIGHIQAFWIIRQRSLAIKLNS